MSKNLIFVSKVGKYLIDFPYLTSTDITNMVLNADTKEKQIEILKEDVKQRFEDPGIIEDVINEICELLNDTNLDLSLI